MADTASEEQTQCLLHKLPGQFSRDQCVSFVHCFVVILAIRIEETDF